jgi:hypothetical protein
MTRKAFFALWILFLTMTFPGVPAAQTIAKLAGTWDVRIQHLSGRVVNEQWLVTQDGNKVTGKVKVAGRELPLEGRVEGNKIDFKVTVSEESSNRFLGTVEGDSIKGEIKKLNDDGTFSAKRTR